MSTPNIAAPHVAASQNGKEVTINDATDALDGAMNRALSLAMSDANLTLTAAQANRNGLIVLTGTLTSVRTVTLPANHRRLAVRNATSGGHGVRVKYAGAGAEVLVPSGATVLVQGNGSDLFGASGASALRDLSDVNITGIADGQSIIWSGAQMRFLPGNVGDGGGGGGSGLPALHRGGGRRTSASRRRAPG